VQRQAEHHRVGERVGHAVRVEQRRHQRFPSEAVQSLGDVEDHVPAIAGGQAVDQPAGVADPVGGVARRGQRRFDRHDGVNLVELGGGLFGKTFRQIIVLQVVSDPDAHAVILAVEAGG